MATTINLTKYNDADLADLAVAVNQEQQRRAIIANAQANLDQVVKNYQQATGTAPTDGAAWKQPTNSLSAYPTGATVTYNGKTWTSTTPANVWTPGVAGWIEKPTVGAAPAAWRQPSGAADAYKKGNQVTYNGAVYESLIDANTWSPEAYPAGWKKVIV